MFRWLRRAWWQHRLNQARRWRVAAAQMAATTNDPVARAKLWDAYEAEQVEMERLTALLEAA